MPPDPPSRHTRLHVCERAFACYYHPATTMFIPSQLKIPYETLLTLSPYTHTIAHIVLYSGKLRKLSQISRFCMWLFAKVFSAKLASYASTKVFSTKSYFSLLCESSLSLKFLAIQYTCTSQYGNLFRALATRNWFVEVSMPT